MKLLVTRFTALATSPAFASDQEIQNITQYLNYELTDTVKALASSTIHYENLISIVDATMTEVNATVSGGATLCPVYSLARPPLGCSYTSSTADARGCSGEPILTCPSDATPITPTPPAVTKYRINIGKNGWAIGGTITGPDINCDTTC